MNHDDCLLCTELVHTSLEPETWGIAWGRGWVHFKCARALFEAVRRVQEADESEMEVGKEIESDDSA